MSPPLTATRIDRIPAGRFHVRLASFVGAGTFFVLPESARRLGSPGKGTCPGGAESRRGTAFRTSSAHWKRFPGKPAREASSGGRKMQAEREDGGARPIAVGSSSSGLDGLVAIDLNLLLPLRLLLEERSVTRAADRMGLSQPAMSHVLARCRKLFDDDLLVRVGKSLELTARGRDLIEPLTRVLHDLSRDVFARQDFDPATSTRSFRISATSPTAMVLLPRLLAGFEREAPLASLQLRPPIEHEDDLLDSPELDIAIAGEMVASQLPREPLYYDRWVVATAPDVRVAGNTISLEEFQSLPHIVFETTNGGRIPAYSLLDAAGITYTIRLRSHDFGLLPILLGQTACVALIQERLAVQFSRARLIRVFQPPVEIPPLRLDLIINPRFARDPARGWLRTQLRLAAVQPTAAHGR
ncbi:LysR family transcriptional regulator [Amycolatopsis pithecellobii]|uniref:LysR family transcriptional regulator n=1 Tax=Amycolatopsis pithecellobii TaxID=664692 RepID=A0A6N7YXF0_9PSEU|nr:LysR family transcriptional regulator [Amycolatopsis pithecellobii]MTD56558.1 LysR family transcriptional regulator [Amycolatopsis pithecellobii]